jgi:hypothetical protein
MSRDLPAYLDMSREFMAEYFSAAEEAEEAAAGGGPGA